MISNGGISAIAASRSSSSPLRSPSTIRAARRSMSGIAASSAARASLAPAAETPSKSSMNTCSGS